MADDRGAKARLLDISLSMTLLAHVYVRTHIMQLQLTIHSACMALVGWLELGLVSGLADSSSSPSRSRCVSLSAVYFLLLTVS